jgi:hypothetical protein
MTDFEDFCFEQKLKSPHREVSTEPSIDELFGTSRSRKPRYNIHDNIEDPIQRKHKESKKRKINEIQSGVEEINFQPVQVSIYVI